MTFDRLKKQAEESFNLSRILLIEQNEDFKCSLLLNHQVVRQEMQTSETSARMEPLLQHLPGTELDIQFNSRRLSSMCRTWVFNAYL